MKKLITLLFSTLSICLANPSFDWNSEMIHCGNLVYGNNQTSVCFAETFLTDAANATGLNIAPKFARIELGKSDVFNTPLCIFTGEGNFSLKPSEVENLRRYLQNGGFILASPGCSNEKWNDSFQKEIAIVLPGSQLKKIPADHEIFSTVHKIKNLTVKGAATYLQGIFINGRLALVYSPEGLNNVKNAKGCCCCGGAEIAEALQVNINAVTYALLH